MRIPGSGRCRAKPARQLMKLVRDLYDPIWQGKDKGVLRRHSPSRKNFVIGLRLFCEGFKKAQTQVNAGKMILM